MQTTTAAKTEIIWLTDEQYVYWECANRDDDAPGCRERGREIKARVLAEAACWTNIGVDVDIRAQDGDWSVLFIPGKRVRGSRKGGR